MMDQACSPGEFCTFETAWCPGCGNFSILPCLKKALTELGLNPHDVLMVAGIGQAAKTPQYIGTHGFCGLHGRALPAAVAAKIANEKLTVIVESGDGDSYGEGGNHFIHNVRRNVDITHFVHDNQLYGLTKGQASPTSEEGMTTDVQVTGSINTPLNPVLLALSLGAGFVARGFSGDQEQLVGLMKQAILFKGYALVDILQPCVSFNKLNTYMDTNKRVYKLDESHDPTDRALAMKAALEFGEHIPTGIFYKTERPTFHDKHSVLAGQPALVDRDTPKERISGLIRSFI